MDDLIKCLKLLCRIHEVALGTQQIKVALCFSNLCTCMNNVTLGDVITLIINEIYEGRKIHNRHFRYSKSINVMKIYSFWGEVLMSILLEVVKDLAQFKWAYPGIVITIIIIHSTILQCNKVHNYFA